MCSHLWQFSRNEEITEGEGKGWWWEYFVCSKCKAEGRELVASPRG